MRTKDDLSDPNVAQFIVLLRSSLYHPNHNYPRPSPTLAPALPSSTPFTARLYLKYII
jgi:hypothetical protein